MTPPIAIRAAKPYDTPLIFSSWLRSYKACRDKHVEQTVYFKEHHKLIDRLLAEGQVLVATPQDDADTILGWCVKSGGCLHFVYVKEAFRRLGIGKALVGEFEQHSHLTPYFVKWLEKTKVTSVYNPYLAMTRI